MKTTRNADALAGLLERCIMETRRFVDGWSADETGHSLVSEDASLAFRLVHGEPELFLPSTPMERAGLRSELCAATDREMLDRIAGMAYVALRAAIDVSNARR